MNFNHQIVQIFFVSGFFGGCLLFWYLWAVVQLVSLSIQDFRVGGLCSGAFVSFCDEPECNILV